MVSVTVQTATHKHQGNPCNKGDCIEVDAITAQFLLRAGVIDKIPAPLNKPTKEIHNG